jgi:hypothetical protein
MRRAILTTLAITTLSLPMVPVLAVGEDPLDPLAVYEEDGYQGGDYGRVRFQESDVTIVRAAAGDLPGSEELATLNSPIYPGDSISTYADQRAEVQLAGGTLIRVDAVSQVTFQSLPDPYAEYPDNAIVQLSYGAVQLSARVTDKEEFRVDTPAASVYLLGDGDFRIEVDDDGRTRVLSRRGVAEIVSEGGSVLVRGGMRTTVYAGFVPDDPSSFNTFVMDEFDRWVRDREGTYRAPEGHIAAQEQEIEPYEDLPTEVKPYYSELSSHGRWVFVADYGYAWYPVGVASSWRPYHRGYWSFGPGGYFWVSHEPWGWAPYHFGRWSWVSGYGWIWIPGSVFSGAWVSWSYGPSYVGWCPLGYYDTPVRAGGIRFGFYGRSSWTFVSYTNLRHREVHRYSVPVDHVGDEIRRHAVVTRPPKASPRMLGDDDLSREREFVVARNDGRGRIPTSVEPPRTTFRDNESVVTRRRVANPRRLDRAPGGGATTGGTGSTVRVPRPTGPGVPGGGGSRPVQSRTTTATTPPSGGSLSSAGAETTPTTRRRTTAIPGNRKPTRPVDRPSSGRDEPAPGVRPPDGNSGTPSRRPAVENRSSGSRAPGGSSGGQIGRPGRDTTATEPRESRRPETDATPGSRLSPTTRRKQTAARPDGDDSRDAGSSVRDMYERMSKPRTTERRETPATGSRSKSPSTSARDQTGSRKKDSSDSSPRATPRSQSRSDTDKGRSDGNSGGRSKSDRSGSSADRSNSNGSSRKRSESTSADRSSGSGDRSIGTSASRSGGSSNRSSSSSANSSSRSSNRSSGSGRSSSSGKKESGRKR